MSSSNFQVGDQIVMAADEYNSDTIDGWITGDVIWKEAYRIKIMCDDGLLVDGDVDEMVAYRGLRKLY